MAACSAAREAAAAAASLAASAASLAAITLLLAALPSGPAIPPGTLAGRGALADTGGRGKL